MMFDQKANTLLTLVQEGSFTKAAQALSLSQPAVSHQIRQLEEEFGIQIFHKDRKELRPTPAGAVRDQICPAGAGRLQQCAAGH